ncbi:MAG: hypothetical protein ACREOU_12910 [Candidatus Eiseniibacteriota bacterium]
MHRSSLFLAAGTLLLLSSNAQGAKPGHSFTFDDVQVGAITISGRGIYDPATGFVQAGGRFVATQDITQGPFAGLHAGEGIRWRATELLANAPFKCVGPDPLKTALTDDDTVVFKATFHQQGSSAHDGATAAVFVSRLDLDPDQPGIQNVWIQLVGCGEANVQF